MKAELRCYLSSVIVVASFEKFLGSVEGISANSPLPDPEIEFGRNWPGLQWCGPRPPPDGGLACGKVQSDTSSWLDLVSVDGSPAHRAFRPKNEKCPIGIEKKWWF